MQAAKRIGRFLTIAPVAWQSFSFHDPQLGELLCYADADWASNNTFRRSISKGVVTLGGGIPNCWAKKYQSVALSNWENNHHVGPEIFRDPGRINASWTQM